MVYNQGFVSYHFFNFSKRIGGGGNRKEPKCEMLIQFFHKF